MEDEDQKQKIGENARMTIVEDYSLDNLAKKELGLMEELV
jgi:glycosyltransferase involved in cell wall biosynthesis